MGKQPTESRIPDSHDDKHGWHRRFTSNVQRALAKGANVTPAQAGTAAKEQTRSEFSQRFPGVPLPTFLP